MEIGAEAALFSEKEYISGILVTVCPTVLYINNSAGFQLDRPSVTRPASTMWQYITQRPSVPSVLQYINNSAGFQLDRPSVTRPASTVGSTSPRGRQKATDSGQVSLLIFFFFNCFYESILILFEKNLPVALFRLSHICLGLKKLCSEDRLWSRKLFRKSAVNFSLAKIDQWWDTESQPEQKFQIWCWFWNILENLLVSVFNAANFLLNKGGERYKTICACTESNVLIK